MYAARSSPVSLPGDQGCTGRSTGILYAWQAVRSFKIGPISGAQLMRPKYSPRAATNETRLTFLPVGILWQVRHVYQTLVKLAG